MKKNFTILLLLIIGLKLSAADIHHDYDPLLKRFITDNKRLPNEQLQKELRAKSAWQTFKQKNGVRLHFLKSFKLFIIQKLVT